MNTSIAKPVQILPERRVSPQMKEFLSGPHSADDSTPQQDHGFVWYWGTLLMGRLRFRSKIAIITLAFLAPLALIGWFFFTNISDQLKFTSMERLGVEYNNALVPTINLAQQLRRDAVLASNGSPPTTMSDVKDKLSKAESQLADINKRLGDTLNVTKQYAAVEAAYTKALAASGPDVFQAHTNHVEALIALLGSVTDNSNLTLDPDITSFYVMDAVYARMPYIAEASAKMRGIGLKVLGSGAIEPVQQRQLSEFIPVAEFQFSNMRDDLNKAFSTDKPALDKLGANGVMESTDAFFKFARANVIDAQNYNPSAQSNLLDSANKAIGEQYALADRLSTKLDSLLVDRINGLNTSMYSVAAIVAAALAVSGYLFYCFYLVTNSGLKLVSTHLKEIAMGDLRHVPAETRDRDETADLVTDLRVTYSELHELIRTVRHSARALHATSGEISSASMDLSARTEAAAASLEQQAAAIEEIGSTVAHGAEKTKMAASFAAENARVATDGGQVIGTVVATMDNINASSAKISDIISVIDGIAFQTNILALNAAVEAARAGEAGRGFAVVASEVRALAHRSADAAKEIKSLISESVNQISTGSSVVQKAGVTMQTMVNNADQIRQYLADISTAAIEQEKGVAEVSAAIHALDQQTQQNAALVEETTAASAALTQQAETLQQEIANFKVA